MNIQDHAMKPKSRNEGVHASRSFLLRDFLVGAFAVAVAFFVILFSHGGGGAGGEVGGEVAEVFGGE